ncbi:hypothetical protein [Photobacterium chitinilyticum]|uniref:Uncharacterized protein n=1 Tax=Photobacterium chitinilyticum TaxID=2485123 RepID=A0A3S3QRY6_9GAMM|nr:hypothetical protein [Photobacterium chitinilyticum]RWX54771.1 hypothetical protein EDI28_13555 [Photobacterium chitinilyticum]
MECNQRGYLIYPLFLIMPQEAFYQSIRFFMASGKTLETLAVTQAQKSIEMAYNQTASLLEDMDGSIIKSRNSVGANLLFPFDVMNYLSTTMLDNWQMLMGGKSTGELKMAEQVENQEKLFSRIEQQLKVQNVSLKQKVSEKEEMLLSLRSESDKVRKAKLAAQRAQRKIKAELELSNDQVLALKAECENFTERYDQQLLDNSLLQTTNKQLERELAEVRQESKLQTTDSEQVASKIDALATEQTKLIAEKDGLYKRIEELQRQLEHSSNYTE